MNRPLRVFLCHSSNDKPTVRELYQKLRAEAWLQPWLDEEELYPVCLSNSQTPIQGQEVIYGTY